MRISVIRYRGAAPPQPIAFDFDPRGGSLGREAGNELRLPDPERHVSRVQAQVDFDGHDFGMVDLGSNPTLVDGKPMIKGTRLPLSGGEVLVMGAYELLVELDSSMPDEAGAGTASATGEGVSIPATEDPFAVFAAPQPRSKPESESPPDPFAIRVPEPVSSSHDALGLGQPAVSASIDELFDLQSGPADAFAGTLLSPSELKPPPQSDPLVLLGGAQDRALQATSEPQRDDAPLMVQAFHAQQPRQPRADTENALEAGEFAATRLEAQATPDMVLSWTGSKPAPELHSDDKSRSPPSVAGDELLDAFLRGLGVPIELPAGLTPALMEQIGLMLREATQGTLDLLKARSITKREVRAEATMIASRDNNPLKFSPDIAFALTQLLTSRSKGFMGASEAMRDAYDDLRAHQLGMMAGMRSALAGVLARFEPSELESRVAAHSLLDRLQPSGRKARLWDLFGHHYQELAREAADDFNALFGKAFLEAYEQQVNRLQGQDPDVGKPPVTGD